MLSQSRKIGLVVSGGGVRATAYHAGVVLYLAEQGMLEQVAHISSVSGGTLFIGLAFHYSDLNWPTSQRYRDYVFHKIKKKLTEGCLQRDAILRCFFPKNWPLLFSRANIIAQSIEKYWGIRGTLGDLPDLPQWSINGTTAETGRRFRLKDGRFGDHELGYAACENFKLASAMAISAAFPIGIGPLAIAAKNYIWHKRENWDALEEKAHTHKYKTINIYDGGVYDNLGIEPMFDIGRQEIKEHSNSNCIILSDAGSQYKRRRIPHSLHPHRVKRLLDITTDQTRALRIRAFINYLQKNPQNGLYCQIGIAPQHASDSYKIENGPHAELVGKETWITPEEANYALQYKTTISKMREEDFELIARHGYESAKSNRLLFW